MDVPHARGAHACGFVRQGVIGIGQHEIDDDLVPSNRDKCNFLFARLAAGREQIRAAQKFVNGM